MRRYREVIVYRAVIFKGKIKGTKYRYSVLELNNTIFTQNLLSRSQETCRIYLPYKIFNNFVLNANYIGTEFMHHCNFVLHHSLNEHGKPNKDLYLKVRE